MTDLLQLAERCEQATETDSNFGPVRQLEIEIHDALFGRKTYNCGGDGQRGIPRYLRSLDAAMTLVPEGWQFGCGSKDATCRAWAWVGDGVDPLNRAEHIASGATPALALCAAALRARAVGQ